MEESNPRGWIWGKYYLGYIVEEQSSNQYSTNKSYSVLIMCTSKFYKELTNPDQKIIEKYENTCNEDESGDTEDKNRIKFYERYGNYFYLQYSVRQLDVKRFTPKTNQRKILDILIDEYKQSKIVTTIIHGEPGSGKSMISIFLAKELNGYLCDSFNPTDPGDDMSVLYNSIMPTPNKPLILVFEEIDTMINKIHKGTIQQHKHIPVQVHSKTSWNTFCDRFDRGLFPNLILILTYNSDPKYIDELDESYLRKGRVNSRHHLKISYD